jgi:hypothetical protein
MLLLNMTRATSCPKRNFVVMDSGPALRASWNDGGDVIPCSHAAALSFIIRDAPLGPPSSFRGDAKHRARNDKERQVARPGMTALGGDSYAHASRPYFVIPGRCEASSPESITTDVGVEHDWAPHPVATDFRGYGFRARAARVPE